MQYGVDYGGPKNPPIPLRIFHLSHNYMEGRLCYTITKSLLFHFIIPFMILLPFWAVYHVYCHVEAKLPSSLRSLYHCVCVTLITTLLQGSSRLLFRSVI